ncbi:TraX family protein (plasmid) [Paraclostridium ghonii]|uniref:TraX family protein n=1 Tax=Paraclostridium ghonii TaxID=29358 RepID=UPI00202D0C51|nr:TraX family protein [Paeniclostridium ghonii]MCM0167106.1 conjugal transfer protein TraX [Paeniclostridium ghonii]
MKKINAFQLKIFALILMLMDHLWEAFPNVFPMWIHPLTRVVAPIFGFLLVEGFFHTRNKLKYNLRLFGWAVFMQVGNMIISFALKSKEIAVGNNIFLTLALGLTIINLIEYSKKKQLTKKLLILVLAIALIPLSFFVEGGITIVPFIIITYLFRGNMKKQIISYLILSAFLFSNFLSSVTSAPNQPIGMLVLNTNFLFILVIPFMFLYNGERGLNNKFSKYLFYVFYPLHLWALAILQYVLK